MTPNKTEAILKSWSGMMSSKWARVTSLDLVDWQARIVKL